MIDPSSLAYRPFTFRGGKSSTADLCGPKILAHQLMHSIRFATSAWKYSTSQPASILEQQQCQTRNLTVIGNESTTMLSQGVLVFTGDGVVFSEPQAQRSGGSYILKTYIFIVLLTGFRKSASYQSLSLVHTKKTSAMPYSDFAIVQLLFGRKLTALVMSRNWRSVNLVWSFHKPFFFPPLCLYNEFKGQLHQTNMQVLRKVCYGSSRLTRRISHSCQ